MIKYLFIFLIFLNSFNLFAQSLKREKIISFKTHVKKMVLAENNLYKVSLVEFAAVYRAPEEVSLCLQKAIKEKKKASLKVGANTLIILDCKVE